MSERMLAEAALPKARARTLMAAKNFARLMRETEYCQEALSELLDAADQLETLERLASQERADA